MRDYTAIPLLIFALVATHGSARAGELFVTGSLGISGATGDSGGSTLFFDNTGSDSDSSPVYGGAMGIAVPSTMRWRLVSSSLRSFG